MEDNNSNRYSNYSSFSSNSSYSSYSNYSYNFYNSDEYADYKPKYVLTSYTKPDGTIHSEYVQTWTTK